MQRNVANTAGKTQNVFEAHFTPLGFFCIWFWKRAAWPLVGLALPQRWKWLSFWTNGICMARRYCLASWILQWESCAYANGSLIRYLKIWDPKYPNAWCVCSAPAVGAQNCPSRRQTISHRRQRQPPRRAHSRRSPISTESHHEIGLQTGKCFIFSLQLTLIRRIPGPSGHIALFTLPCSFFIHEEAVTCLPWMTACLPACLGFFLFAHHPTPSSEVVSRDLTTWQTSDVIKRRINSPNCRLVMGRMKPRVLCLWNCLRRVGPGSNWNATIFCYISRRMRNLIILSLCFLQEPYFFAICMNIWGSWRWAARDGQLVWLQAVRGFRRVSSSALETAGCCFRQTQMKATLHGAVNVFGLFRPKNRNCFGSQRRTPGKIKLGALYHQGIKHSDVSRTT